MIRRSLCAVALAAVSAAFAADAAQAQLPEHLRDYPLAQLRPSGDLIAPFFDGWFANPDGTYTYQFGYMNRNTEEVVDIPLGPQNYLEIRHDGHAEPAEQFRPGRTGLGSYPGFDGVQPTRFYVYDRPGFNGKRERGTFAVTVPDKETEVVWTLSHAGHTYSVPGRATSTAYELSWGKTAFGSLRPAVRFSPTAPESRGPEGPWTALEATQYVQHGSHTLAAPTDSERRLFRLQKEQEQFRALIEETLSARDVRLYPERLQEIEEAP